jgi:predicted RNase H-like HicB family nuclease
MKTIKYTWWQDGEFYIGFLNDYPDYETQGYSREELMENLRDLLKDLESGEVPYVRKTEDLLVA